MVELQPSKLTMGVRFSLPAPMKKIPSHEDKERGINYV